jgi:hypothetical protein
MNDCVRQTISSSQISLSKLFVALITSALALVLRTFLRVGTFRIFLEQQAVIRFVTLKGLRPSAIATELQSVYETKLLALSTMKK